MIRTSSLLSVVGVGLLVVSVALAASADEAVPSYRQMLPMVASDDAPARAADRIAFLSTMELTEGQFGSSLPSLYVMEADGGAVRMIGRAVPQDCSAFDWSPDGTRLVFASYYGASRREGEPEDSALAEYANLFLAQDDGSQVTNLTNFWRAEYDPSWSPDGKQIAFVARTDEWVNVINIDGSGRVELEMEPYGVSSPQWSPDGGRIAFRSRYSTGEDDWKDAVWVVNKDGSELVQVAVLSASSIVRWSPDGEKLVFAAWPGNLSEGLYRHLFVATADGSEVQQITSGPLFIETPLWAPDGRRIAYASTKGGTKLNIFTSNPDGSSETQLTDASSDNAYPMWSRDGTRIAFMSDRDGNVEIYVMGADGSGQTNISRNSADDGCPDWSP